jgi:hypothetical protein
MEMPRKCAAIVTTRRVAESDAVLELPRYRIRLVQFLAIGYPVKYPSICRQRELDAAVGGKHFLSADGAD